MSKEKKDTKKVTLFGYDPVESPEEVIASDKDNDRREAFKEAYKRVMSIIPNYFLTKKRKPGANGSAGGKGFSQNIIVTSENAKIETKEDMNKEEVKQEEKIEEKERE